MLNCSNISVNHGSDLLQNVTMTEVLDNMSETFEKDYVLAKPRAIAADSNSLSQGKATTSALQQ